MTEEKKTVDADSENYYCERGVCEDAGDEMDSCDEDSDGVEGAPEARGAQDEACARAGSPTVTRCFTTDTEGGRIWHAQIVTDDYSNPKHCLADGSLKPRRPIPHIRASDFFGSLTHTADGRWIYEPAINGWTGLFSLELRSITCKDGRMQKPKRLWDKKKTSEPPSFPIEKHKSVRATLRCPRWSEVGWSEDSPGFVFWAALQGGGSEDSPAFKVYHGEGMISALQDGCWSTWPGFPAHGGQVVRAHLIAHRYASTKESAKDKLLYHTALLLEWDHKLFTSITELGFRNGLGGYGCKSNWCADKDCPPPTSMAKAMPSCMLAPWRTDLAELRVTDHCARNIEEFKHFIEKHTGPTKRFLAPEIAKSVDVKMSFRSQQDICRLLLNYMGAEQKYTESDRNCQHYAADLFGFLSKEKNYQTYSTANRVFYKPKPYWFLHEPDYLQDFAKKQRS